MDKKGNLLLGVDQLLRHLPEALRGPVPPRIAAGAAALALMLTVICDGRALYEACSAARTASPGSSANTHGIHPDGGVAQEAIRALIAAHLFGISESRSAAAAAAAASQDTTLVLTGTIVTDDPAVGYALIGPNKDKAQIHQVGAHIDGSAVLREVYADRVVVERAGQLATVYFPRHASFSASRQSLPAADAETAEAAPVSPPETRQQDIEARLAEENERTGAVLREEPYFSQGQFRGIRIEPGTDRGLLVQLGLRPGDVLHHVDGTMVVQADRLDMLRRKLASGRPVEVSIIRPGVGPIDVTLNGGLVAAMVEN